MCAEDSWLQTTYRAFFGEAAPADPTTPPEGTPTPEEVEAMLAQRGLDLSSIPKKRGDEKKEL
jgi:hypothetical protein